MFHYLRFNFNYKKYNSNLKGQCTSTIQAHSDSVSCLELLSNERVISGSYGEIKIWNIATNSCINTLSGQFNWVRCLQPILNDRIISGGGDQTIKIWYLNLPMLYLVFLLFIEYKYIYKGTFIQDSVLSQ